ncbi:hypothetical protein A2V49_04775 [candidate division WWE3 bacterium RBG_19FT_COMBO_34_6]|uniref:Uncharacterized protein n=1 Tax=candidate division WWE3 bacterium RBG_19FT_COMBO_34_6 TaxID=1802612 RepID=A0A1F4UKY6_UNCKA|nr:MAG: hypothetical protein A2V49_04775 [candidate division WWE3 bacterium RBG_19FT_COMBO_34_6]
MSQQIIHSLQDEQNYLELSFTYDYLYLVIKAKFGQFITRWSAIEKNKINLLFSEGTECLDLKESPYGIDTIRLMKDPGKSTVIRFTWLDISKSISGIMDFYLDDFAKVYNQLFYSVK